MVTTPDEAVAALEEVADFIVDAQAEYAQQLQNVADLVYLQAMRNQALTEALAACEAGCGGTPPSPPDVLEGWDLSYDSSFPDLAGWTVYNNQTQDNDNSINLAKNVSAGADGLVILGKKEGGYSRPYTSGEVVGKSAELVVPNYFRAEVVGIFEDISGVWPCLLWYRPQAGGDGSNGELDVMEWMGGLWDPHELRVAVTMHNEYGSTQDSIKKPMTLKAAPWYDPAVEHTYVIEKTPGKVVVFIDGQWQATFSAADKGWWSRIMEAADRTWYPRFTLQIGRGAKTQVVPNPDPDFTDTSMAVRRYRTWVQA